MNKRKVFLLLLICHVPVDRILIGNKWVLVIKRDGRHRSRMVVLGYTQIPGVDFSENFAKLYEIHQPNIVQDSGLIAKFDTDRDKYFYDIDYLDDDIYENSEPTNRKGGPTLSYYDFIYYDIADRYFDIDDVDLYNFEILGHFAFEIISHVTINSKKSTLSFYRKNEARNLSNLSKTEKSDVKGIILSENFER